MGLEEEGSCQLSFPTVLLVASNAINSFTGTWAFESIQQEYINAIFHKKCNIRGDSKVFHPSSCVE